MSLPILEKNAYLSIYIDSKAVYANLAYSHYEIGRHYTLSDKTELKDENLLAGDDKYWWWYFAQLEKSLNWELFDLEQADKQIIEPQKFVDEGYGVAGITVKIHNSNAFVQETVSSLRAFCPKINIQVIDDQKIGKSIADLALKTGYQDVLYLDINLMELRAIRAVKKSDRQTLDMKPDELFALTSAKIKWDNRSALIENLKNSKLKAFLASEVSFDRLASLWANFVLNPTSVTNNPFIKDIIRSLVTLQLLSMFNENFSKFNNFANRFTQTALIISGDLIRILDEKTLTLSVLDGLEINGQFDLFVDPQAVIMSYAEIVALGNNSSKFITFKSNVFPPAIKVLSPNVASSKTAANTVFAGSVVSQQSGERDLFAITPQLTSIEINPNEKTFLEGQFVKGSSLPVLQDRLNLISDPSKETYKAIYIDCRPKPAVYGPTATSNRDKLKAWLS